MSRRVTFTPESNIQKALDLDERVPEAFKKLGLKCIECAAAFTEDLRLAALYHEKNLDEIIETLNRLGIKEKEVKQDGEK